MGKPPQSRRPNGRALIGSVQNSVRFINNMSRRPSHQSKGREEHTRRFSDRLKHSIRWMSGKDEDMNYDLNRDKNDSSDGDDDDYRSDDGSETNQALLAIEPEEEPLEEERLKAKKKRKKAKRGRRDADEEI